MVSWTLPFPETVGELMGVRFHRVNRAQLLECFATGLEEGNRLHFTYLNVDVSNQAARNSALLAWLNEADLVYVDGAGIRLGCSLTGKWCPPRNTGADFLPEVMALCAARKKKVGLLGGTPGAAAGLASYYREKIPELEITPICDGFEELANEGEWLPRLVEDPPDLLLVGLGVPLQQKWVAKHRDLVEVKVFWTVGALFEYDSGKVSRCPEWMGKVGLEWLFRLWTEPRRLWRRYLVGNPRFLLRCLCSRWQARGGTH